MFRKSRTRKRTALALAAAVAVLPVLAGCSVSNGASGHTTLTVMTGTGDLSKEQLAEFAKKNPDITVKIIALDPSRLNTMLASGNPPDLVSGPATGSANYNARGLSTDLTPYLKDSKVLKESDLQPVNNGFRWD